VQDLTLLFLPVKDEIHKDFFQLARQKSGSFSDLRFAGNSCTIDNNIVGPIPATPLPLSKHSAKNFAFYGLER
jgi:hypothetical protein